MSTEKPHPFAAALVDFNENIDDDFYNQFREYFQYTNEDYAISHTSAYLIDLDGYRCEKNGENIELDAPVYIQQYYPYFHQSFISKVLGMEISYVDIADNGSDRVHAVYILTGENGKNLISTQDDTAGRERIYTIEQIQAALQPQFQMGDWGAAGSPQVVSVQKVERDRDSITLESGGPGAAPIDLSNSSRYQVVVKYEQSLEEYNMRADIYKDSEDNPFRREGGFTLLTGYYYFNDVNGMPELAYVAC
jgi:hypothetical protein